MSAAVAYGLYGLFGEAALLLLRWGILRMAARPRRSGTKLIR